MKRHQSLINLSKDHYHGLLLAQMIKKGAPQYRGMPNTLEGKLQYTLTFWSKELIRHFEEEEKILLPFILNKNEHLNNLCNKMLQDHNEIKEIIDKLKLGNDIESLLNDLGFLLERHIRMEEREMFESIIIMLTPLVYFISVMKKESFVLENYGLPSHVKRISERERLKKEMEIAAKVQLSLLPKEDPKIPGYEIASTSIPAVEAGGDYYDFVKLSGNKIGIAIGDVSGKGVGAAIYMTLTKGILQAHAEEDASPKNVLGKVNRLLYKTIEKNSFVSMFYAILDTENNSIIYSRAGHNPGILCSEQDGNTKLLFSKGMALGLEQGSIFTSTLNEEEIKINKGDVFVLYTDGFTEAMNERHELYSEERLVELIKKNRNLSPHDLLNLVLKDVKKFVDNYPQHDDMTILILKKV